MSGVALSDVVTAAEIKRPTHMAAIPVIAMSNTSSSTGGLMKFENFGPCCCDTAISVSTVDCTITNGMSTTSFELR